MENIGVFLAGKTGFNLISQKSLDFGLTAIKRLDEGGFGGFSYYWLSGCYEE